MSTRDTEAAEDDLASGLAWGFRDHGTEQAYRQHFLAQDRRNASIAIATIMLLKLAFGAIDFMVQTEAQAEILLLSRFAFLGVSIAAIVGLARTRTPARYDLIVLGWTLIAVLGTFYTISQRPATHFGFLSTSPVLIVLIFSFFRNRFSLQLLSAGLLTAGDLFTVYALRDPQPHATYIHILSTYFLANLVGIVVAWQLKTSRRNYFATLRREQELVLTLEQLAYRDELTGVLNRRSFLMQAATEWQRGSRYGRPASMLMLDLDHFKALNDRHGHELGDRALVEFTHLVESLKREQDIFGRIGGEEFALLLPETDLAQAVAMAERVLSHCRELVIADFVAGGALEEARLSVSIGIAEVAPGDHDLATTMRRADQALYQAKAEGRARAVAARPEPARGQRDGMPAAYAGGDTKIS